MPIREPADSSNEVLWDVVTEHLDEAAFGIEQFERALEHPARTLSELERYPESRLLAHIDGLVIAGEAVWQRSLAPLLASAEFDSPEQLTAAALALLLSGQTDPIWCGLAHADAVVRAATLRAIRLCASPVLDRAVILRLQAAGTNTTRATFFDLIAQRHLSPPPLFEHLQDPDSSVVAAAARASLHADSHTHLAIVEDLLTHPNAEVKQAALITALTWDSPRAWSECLTLATQPGAGQRTAMTLLSLLGGRRQHARLLELLDDTSSRRHALFALGYSGDLEVLPQLLLHLASPDAKLAAEAIATILGLDIPALEPQQSNDADPELPPLVDDLETVLLPTPEDALPAPDPDAVAALVAQRVKELPRGQRYLHGQVLTRDTLLAALELGPLRRRHVLALALSIRSGGTSWLDTRSLSRVQLCRLAELRKLSGTECQWSSGPESF